MPAFESAFNHPCHWWRGASGAWHVHLVYEAAAVPALAEANYIFVRRRVDGLFDPLYIGQTAHLGERFQDHEKWPLAMMLGMTHVHVHVGEPKQERFRIETDLRNRFDTPLNRQPTIASALGDLGSFFPEPKGALTGLAPLGWAGAAF